MPRAMSLATKLRGLAFLLPGQLLRVSEGVKRIEGYLGVLLSYFKNFRRSQEDIFMK